MAALTAQDDESAGRTLPLSVSQWIQEALIPLTETDLLRGRLRVPWTVTEIVTVPIELEEDEEDDGSIPPDFRLTLVGTDGQTESLDTEAVIVAVGERLSIELGFSLPTPYFFRIGAAVSGDWEESLWAGYREIVDSLRAACWSGQSGSLSAEASLRQGNDRSDANGTSDLEDFASERFSFATSVSPSQRDLAL